MSPKKHKNEMTTSPLITTRYSWRLVLGWEVIKYRRQCQPLHGYLFELTINYLWNLELQRFGPTVLHQATIKISLTLITFD